jgi:uncharacterized protein (DUF2147 family)
MRHGAIGRSREKARGLRLLSISAMLGCFYRRAHGRAAIRAEGGFDLPMIGRCARFLALGAPLIVAGAAHAADPVGTWVTEGGEATIRIAPCGGALCGHIAGLRERRDPRTGRVKTDENNRDPKLRKRPLIGVQIVVGMTRNGRPRQWGGHVYNPEDGGVYPATLILSDARSLRLEGCMVEGVLCRGQTWTRVR